LKQLFVLALIVLMLSLVFVSSGFSPFKVKAESWQINVSGLVSQQLNITLATLQAMPQTDVIATLFCVSAPTTPIEGSNWQGVKLWTLLSQAGISSSATKIAFYASDGFSTDLTIDVAQDPTIIVAYTLNDKPLGQGEIPRLVVPGHYGYKWIDQITSIVAINYDYKIGRAHV
jgi:DMSO/TMAO reductase YedYZ molybdopterin-dependent catalytic subunit